MIGRRSAALAGGQRWLSPVAPRREAWPQRPIKLIAPFAPGGGSDFTSRLVAEKLTARLGQTMLVENKPGAGGNLGAEAAIKSPPDGYTYLTISGSYASTRSCTSRRSISLDDIVAIGQFTRRAKRAHASSAAVPAEDAGRAGGAVQARAAAS